MYTQNTSSPTQIYASYLLGRSLNYNQKGERRQQSGCIKKYWDEYKTAALRRRR